MELQQDVMYWDNWPVAHPFLVFGAYRFGVRSWLETWKTLDHFPANDEVIRNLPVRNPVIWMELIVTNRYKYEKDNRNMSFNHFI